MEHDRELVDEFIAEAHEHLATVEDDILALERGGAAVDADTVNHLFRALHTVKGGAALMGFTHIAEVAHALENRVGRVRSGEIVPDKALSDILLKGTDTLKRLVVHPDDDSSGTDEEPAIQPAEPAPRPSPALAEAPHQDVPEAAAEPDPGPLAEAGTEATGDQTVRISLALLDRLMNLASELVLVRNQNVQATESRNLEQLTAIGQRLNVVTSDLQATVMQTRMRPIGSVFTKFTRVVRDLARKLGKELDLVIVGSEVELDKTIVEAIADPLTHLVRNAVDHGIEKPADRVRAGKTPGGRLSLRAFHQDGQVFVQIQDDGKGMDPAVLRAAAVSKGILRPEEANALSDAEAFNLIFRPGFSTAAVVSDVSGRGVGMDVVKSCLQRLGGTVEIRSVVGKGTTITVKLPLTLAIVPTLIVAVGEHLFAIPQANIDEVVWLHGAEVSRAIERVSQQEVYWLRGKLLPVLRLARILNLDAGAADVPESAYIVVLKYGSENFGLVVDVLVDTKEIVVKPLHEQLKDCRAFSGTTVLGDGRIALILDLLAVAELGSVRFTKTEERAGPTRSTLDEPRTVLLFDVGSPERFAVPLCLITRVEEIQGAQVQVANQREYLNYRDALIPLVRVEQAIPGVAARYPGDPLYVIIPKSRRPFGVVATHILDTVEVPREVDTTTVRARAVSGCQLVGGRMTLFLDPFAAIETLEPGWFGEDGGGTPAVTRVLLVDDSPFSRMLLASYLRETGVTVVTAENGREALAVLAQEPCDLILCDLDMPVMDGYEFARTVRQQPTHGATPMMAVSGAGEEVRQAALDAGFNDFRNKFDRRKFLEAFARLAAGMPAA